MADDAPSDWNDPCAVVLWLRPKVAALITGGQPILVRSGLNRETRFGPGDVEAASAMLADYEAQCARKNGDRKNRRHAIRFG